MPGELTGMGKRCFSWYKFCLHMKRKFKIISTVFFLSCNNSGKISFFTAGPCVTTGRTAQ